MSKEISSIHAPAALSVIIAAAGNASRLGLNESKQFLVVNKKPLLYYSLEKFITLENLVEIIIVTNEINETNKLINKFSLKDKTKIKVILGGKLRQQSIYNGFQALSESTDLVLIHDVARPLFEIDDLKRCLETASTTGAAILCTPVVDTIKKSKLNNDELLVESTVERDSLYQVQTPQIFTYKLLKDIYKNPNILENIATDESKLVETMGKPVNLVIGSRKNIKITYSEDIEIMKAYLKEYK